MRAIDGGSTRRWIGLRSFARRGAAFFTTILQVPATLGMAASRNRLRSTSR